MTESAEGRLRAVDIDAVAEELVFPLCLSSSEREVLRLALPTIERMVLGQTAEQIKALPIYGLRFLYRDDVLAVLAEMRGNDG